MQDSSQTLTYRIMWPPGGNEDVRGTHESTERGVCMRLRQDTLVASERPRGPHQLQLLGRHHGDSSQQPSAEDSPVCIALEQRASCNVVHIWWFKVRVLFRASQPDFTALAGVDMFSTCADTADSVLDQVRIHCCKRRNGRRSDVDTTCCITHELLMVPPATRHRHC